MTSRCRRSRFSPARAIIVSSPFVAVALILASTAHAQFLEIPAESASPLRGLRVESSYIWDVGGPVSGVANRTFLGGGLGDLILGLDREFAAGALTIELDAQWHHGVDPSEVVGDAQAYSNIAAPGYERIAEFFAEFAFAGDWLRLKAGKLDANLEFAATDRGGDFVNSSMGFSPTIAFPTYPDNGLGSVAEVAIAGHALRVGVYDSGERANTDGLSTSFESVTWMVQLDRAWQARGGGRLGLGLWRDTAPATRFDGSEASGTDGLYVTLDQTLWMPTGATDDRGLSLIAQWGVADERVSEIDGHLGAGLVWAGPWASRPSDSAGLGFTRAAFTDAFGPGILADAEMVWEAYYRFGLGDHLAIQPDLQWIGDPGGATDADAVTAFTLRMLATF